MKTKKNWMFGDGSPVRDFIFSEDVAKVMMHTVYKKINYPINVGSGKGVSIKKLVNSIINIKRTNIKINWQKDKPSGDKKKSNEYQQIE